MGLILVIAGLLLWLVGGYFVAGLILLVIGVVLLFAPGPWYGYGWYRGRGRRGAP
jgi:membrane-bound ClpP family serine protease